MTNFSDYSYDKVFDVEYSYLRSLRNSVKKNSISKYILFLLLIFGILSIFITVILYYNNEEEELV
tara:strand:+ start:130 stop:324 length:195 start_codon:yes stop_codon:yes gene_type:complete